jgi:hypothetical protein
MQQVGEDGFKLSRKPNRGRKGREHLARERACPGWTWRRSGERSEAKVRVTDTALEVPDTGDVLRADSVSQRDRINLFDHHDLSRTANVELARLND